MSADEQRLHEQRLRLAGDLRNAGYIRGAVVSHAAAPDLWFETELVLTRPGLLSRAAAALQKGIPEQVDRLAARGAPALLLAAALALRTGIPLLFWREQDGRTGTIAASDGSTVEGELFPAARVVVIEDVVLTGDHALDAISSLRAADLDVIAVAGLLDREGDGRFRIEQEGIGTFFAFRERDLQP